MSYDDVLDEQYVQKLLERFQEGRLKKGREREVEFG